MDKNFLKKNLQEEFLEVEQVPERQKKKNSNILYKYRRIVGKKQNCFQQHICYVL
jgi:hypothetical protein